MGKVRDRAWGYPNSGVVRKGLSRRGNTYVVVLGLEAILAIAFAAVFLQEAVSVPQLCGAALVVLGVAILELSD